MKTWYGMGIKLAVLVCVLGVYAWAAPSVAEKLAGKCPEGTFAFAATSGCDQLDSAFDQSSIGRLWNDPNVQTFVTQVKDAILKKVELEITKDGDPQSSQIVPTMKTLLEELVACPRLAGISDIAGDPNQKFPYRIFVMVEGQTHKEKIKTSIDKLEGMIGTEQIVDKPMGNFTFRAMKESEVPVAWGWYRDTFVFLVNDENGDTLKGLRLQTPKTTPLSKLTDHGDILALYCDVQKFSTMITNIVGTMNVDSTAPQQEITNNLSQFKTVLQMLGLSNVKSLTLRAGFDRKDVIVEKWLEVPAPRTGLFATIKPMDLTMLDKADSRASTVMSFNVDTAGVYDLIMQVVDRLAPTQEHRDQIKAAIAGMETQWNIKLRDGFLQSLNGPMIGYAYPAMTLPQSPMGGFVLTARLKDAALFTQNMQALGQAMTANFQGDPQQSLKITQQPLDGGLTATAWMFPQVAMLQIIPNWVIVDDCVIISSHPTIANLAVAQCKAASPEKTSIRSLTSFAMMQSKLPKNLVYLQYSDTAVNAKQMYTQLQQFWPMATAGATGQGIMLPVMLPNIQDKLGQLGQSWSYAWMDETGIRSRYQGSGAEISAASVAGAAMGAAVLLPALSRAKTTAQSAIAMTDLKQIGLACIMYADDNNNQFPPNLEAAKKYLKTNKVLESPRKPKDFTGPSYIYVAGQTTSSPIGNILAYEAPECSRDGKINVLFLDGHVEIMPLADFHKKLDQTKANIGSSGVELQATVKIESDPNQ
ncbi:MAG: hypothetical protein ABFD91_10040 [Anaerohalosphaeraceae bacterium]